MVAIRLSIALGLLLDARDKVIGTMFLPALVLAVALDVADGTVARRLGTASLQLRRADSFADMVLFYSIVIAAWLTHDDLLRPYLPIIALVVILQIIASAVPVIKYKAFSAYHTWCSRVAGALLFLAAIQLFLFASAGPLLMFALLAVCISCLESVAITLSLPMATSDVPGIRHALRIRHLHMNHTSS